MTTNNVNTNIIPEMIEKSEISKYLEGNVIKLDVLKNKKFWVVKPIKIKSAKPDCDYYYAFQVILQILENGKKKKVAYHSHSGSREIKAFFDKAVDGKITLPLIVKLCADGKALYFDGHRSYAEDTAKRLVEQYGISDDDFDDCDVIEEINN